MTGKSANLAKVTLFYFMSIIPIVTLPCNAATISLGAPSLETTVLPSGETIFTSSDDLASPGIPIDETVSIDVLIAETGNLGVSVFDITLEYDNAALDLVSYSLSNDLGTFWDVSRGEFDPGKVNLCGLSDLFADDLIGQQNDEAIIGTLQFKGKTPGSHQIGFITAPLTFTDPETSEQWVFQNEIGDAYGMPISPVQGYDTQYALQIGGSSPVSPISQVPEPSVIILLIAGIFGLFTIKTVEHRMNHV